MFYLFRVSSSNKWTLNSELNQGVHDNSRDLIDHFIKDGETLFKGFRDDKGFVRERSEPVITGKRYLCTFKLKIVHKAKLRIVHKIHFKINIF